MKHIFNLEYWEDDGWFVGRLKEVPGIFSQGETLEELKENINDAYQMMRRTESDQIHDGTKILELGIEM